MRAVRPAAVALLLLAVLMALNPTRQAVAGVPETPSTTVTASAPAGDAQAPQATSLPGAEESSQSAIDDILAATAVVLVSGASAIAGLMRGRL